MPPGLDSWGLMRPIAAVPLGSCIARTRDWCCLMYLSCRFAGETTEPLAEVPQPFSWTWTLSSTTDFNIMFDSMICPCLPCTCAFSCVNASKALQSSFARIVKYEKNTRAHTHIYIYIWEPIANASLRIMKGHVYFGIRDCKTLHRDCSAIGSRFRQTFVV